MKCQDWENITFKKPTVQEKRPPNPAGHTKFLALDSDDPPAPEKPKISICIEIQKARQLKKWSQKDLAFNLNMSPIVIANYESGKEIPNRQVLSIIGKKLGVKFL
jgi:putative transcription factor